MENVSRILKDFFRQHLNYLDAKTLFCSFGQDLPIIAITPVALLQSLSVALQPYLSAVTQKSIYLAPAWGIEVAEELISENVILVPGDADLSGALTSFGDFKSIILSGAFPPFQKADNHTQLSRHDSWVGCYATSITEGDSMLHRIAGALSMAMEFPKSRAFSSGTRRRGRVSLCHDGAWSLFDRASIVPPLLSMPLLINVQMVKMLRGLLVDCAENQRMQIALEYIAAGWQPMGRLGFLHNAVALDALFGIQGRVKENILDGIDKFVGPRIVRARDRGELLIKMRNALLHGKKPSVEQCDEYLQYYDTYDVDPAVDQINILKVCLWEMSGVNEV